MMKRSSVTLLIFAAVAAAAIVALALTLFGGGETEADVVIEGVSTEELAESGFIVKDAPPDADPAVRAEDIVEGMKDVDPGLEVLDIVLVTFKTDDGGVFSDERLAWAVSLDPKTFPPGQIHGGGFGLSQEARTAMLRTPAYSVEFIDAQTGEFLMAATSSSTD
jgi:hypothetical protein